MTIGKFISDKWAEIVIIGILGIILHTIFFDMRDRLTKIEVSNDETKNRIDKIADVLPDMRIRLANEIPSKAVQTIVLASLPKQDLKGQWFMNAQVVESTKGILSNYSVPLSNRDDLKNFYAIAGVIRSVNEASYSFKDMDYLKAGGTTLTVLPGDWQKDASFAYVDDKVDLIAKFKDAGLLKTDELKFAPKEMNWEEFVSATKSGSIPLLKFDKLN